MLRVDVLGNGRSNNLLLHEPSPVLAVGLSETHRRANNGRGGVTSSAKRKLWQFSTGIVFAVQGKHQVGQPQ